MRILNLKTIIIFLIILLFSYLENSYIINLLHSQLDPLIPRFNFEMINSLMQPELEQGFLSNIRTQSVLIYTAIFFILNAVLTLAAGHSPHLFFVHLGSFSVISILSLMGLVFFTLFPGTEFFYDLSRILKDFLQSPIYSALLIIYYTLIRHTLMPGLRK